MRPVNRFPGIVLVAVGVVLCGWAVWNDAPPRSAAQAPANGEAAAEPALKGLDPVALAGGKEVPGDRAIALDRNGYRYLFATEENRKRFEGDPTRYEIQRDGHCGAMPGVKGDPGLFAVVKGRVYLFASPGCRAAFTAEPEKFLKPRKNVAVFVHEGVELLDFAGPAEAFAAAEGGRAFNVFTVAASDGDVVSQGFLTIKPRYTLANCPRPDVIVLPGGNTRVPLGDDRVIRWIRTASPDAEVVMSVCTGAFLLAKAGLLDGKEATTHWGSIEALSKAAPKSTVHADRRFVDNGKVVTCAGVSAGIDGALHVIERMQGRQAAQETARYMEYRWEPAPRKE
jgi:putative intracellular protease/amidase/YHS domain-containing protein